MLYIDKFCLACVNQVDVMIEMLLLDWQLDGSPNIKNVVV